MSLTCAWCGAVPTDGTDEPPLTWTSSLERGRTVWFCERCSRENLRAIEARLGAEWF